jgi:peptidoglycan/xylan/chitin deacetylase (PgdA/CDA1 family)
LSARVRPYAAAVITTVLALALSACTAAGGIRGSALGTPTPVPTTTPPPPAVIPVNQGPPAHGPFGSLSLTGSPAVALTFDDGPDATYTPQMLDLLKAQGVKATFCLVGRQAHAFPQLVKRIVDEGHTLCNHTYNHPLDLGRKDIPTMLKEIQDTTNAIHAAVPDAPVKYFRAPGGNFTQLLVNVAASQGMKSLYWAVDPRDWDFSRYATGPVMEQHIISTIQTKARPGVIVLSHDYKKPDTLAAYRQLLPWLKKSFTLVPMPLF